MSSKDETSRSLCFESEAKFELARFPEFPFGEKYRDAFFATTHKGLSYRWEFGLLPNGGVLDNGKESRNCHFFLGYVEGPQTTVKVSLSVFLKVEDTERMMASLFNCSQATGSMLMCVPNCSIDMLEKEGCFVDGIATVGVKIEMAEALFDLDKIYKFGKEETDRVVGPNFAIFPPQLFRMIDSEPAHGICYKLIVGVQKTTFFCMPQVLELNSAYFKRKLADKKETEQEFLLCDENAMRSVVQYLHERRIPENLAENVHSILQIAHIFELPELLLECDVALCKRLSPVNDVDTAILSHHCGLKISLNKAMNCLIDRLDQVLRCRVSVRKMITARLSHSLFAMVTEGRRCISKTVSGSSSHPPCKKIRTQE